MKVWECSKKLSGGSDDDEGTLLDGTYKRDFRNANGTFSPTGRIKFGTESNGGFKNITVSNCVFDYCRGIALEAVVLTPFQP